MDADQANQIALNAANLALTGSRPRATREFGSVEFRASISRTPRFDRAKWDLMASLTVGLCAVLGVVACWLW